MKEKDLIAYDLNYWGGTDATWRLIVNTIARLPQDVRDFALEECAFLSVGVDILGTVVPPRLTAKVWFVLLADGLSAEDGPGIVAHEIAHAWLGHDFMAPPANCEPEAANLVASWGFTGDGADPDRHSRIHGR